LLEGLYEGAVSDAKSRSERVSVAQLEAMIARQPLALDALAAFAPRSTVHVLAEIKRASPSRGVLAEIPEPSELASTYEKFGATGISVLTESRKFLGSLEDLRSVRSSVSVPLLRKDFIANEYQILEARAYGADLALLIAAGLDQPTLIRLKNFTEQLGMTAFVETHNRIELERALEIGSRFVGINARDLSTFETNRHLFGELVHLIPDGVIKVAESAVRDSSDVAHYRESGADVVLVGEALVVGDAGAALKSFLRNN
jgi:indole-3-glycerol phosphate synthase